MRNIRSWSVCALMCVALFCSPARMHADGWTPTDGGLVVNLEQGDRFLLSVMVDHDNNPSTPDREYFVVNYSRYEGDDYFHYKKNDKFIYAEGKHLKLAQQDAHATEPSEMSIWSVGAPLTRVIGGKDYSLGANAGHVYTIWNDGKTLRMNNTSYQFFGDLTSDYNYKDAADVVFVIPTTHTGITSFDPNKTLKEIYKREDQDATTGLINGKIGKGFLGMTYREVYMLDIPRQNNPISYTNASLVCFNTTAKDTTYAKPNAGSGLKVGSGMPVYAFADPKHRATVRTLFRLYLLDKPFNYCSSYFFATDGQDFMNYRYTQSLPGDSTAKKKIYTIDWMSPMKRVGTSDTFKTDFMTVPTDDSTYYYVGYKNDFRTTGESLGSNTAKSAFKKIRTLPLTTLPSPFVVPAGAYGQMVVDTSSTDNNLGVKFEPAGYFLKVSSKKNVRMHQTSDTTWLSQEMWTITEAWSTLSIKATLMTGPSFTENDPGADIAGWSKLVAGTSIPVSDGTTSVVNKAGYAQITVNNTDSNGHIVFILADTLKWIRYDNNGLVGLEMPLQYPLEGKSSVTLMAPRIKPGYTFYGWCEKADGKSDTLKIGDTFDFGERTGEVKLYALASYEGTLHVAISFKKGDGKRYFLTHPGTGTGFRYARARHFDSWVNTWQGMENAQNLNPNYLSTYEVRHPIAKIKKKDDGVISDISPKEHVLDPRSYTMKGQTDSLTFYENFHPTHDEYLGLYYQNPNTILANNTWAGLFHTTSTAPTSWPTFRQPYIESAKIKSERYVEEYDKENKPDSLILKVRSNSGAPYVKYDTVNDQFNGQADSATATDFQLTAVSVSDEHYILLPDTAYAWEDTITFDYHQGKQTTEDIWSALVGKQLMAVMVVDRDTVYFHPNRKKQITDPNDLYLSPEFRVTQLFKWIPDSRVTTVAEEDRVAHSTTDHYWHHTVTSGMNSPMDVKDKSGNYIDIVDTFSITLSQGAISKIKKYYGRWEKQGADDGLTVSADGLTRQRNIIVKTKTYHYGEEQKRMVLKPEKESYDFGPLANQSQQINFILTRVHVHDLLDAQGNFVREDTISIDTLTTQLGMQPGQCTFRVGTAFEKVEAETRDSHATVRVINDNTSGINYDTLVVTGYLYDNKPQTCDVRIPLMQAPLEGNDLLWSVMHNGQRYFIMAGKGTTQDSLIFRQYTQRGNTLYKRIGGNQLIMGAKDKTNRDEGYITPWQFTYVDKENHQFTLKIGLTASDTLLFNIASAATPAVGDSASTLTYVFTDVYANDNANYEEQVKLKYGPDQWLKFNGSALVLTTNELEADTFSLAYPLLEFNLLNNGTYPSQNQAAFGYNATASASITTAYQGYCEYSTLLDNKLTYFARESRNTREALTSTDAAYRWKTTCKIDTLRDRRTTTESGLTFSNSSNSFTSTITPDGLSPIDVKDASDNYIDIVDTLCVTLGLQTDAPSYRFKGDWSGFKRIEDGNLKIPLVRKTYHEASFDSLICEEVTKAERHSFPAVLVKTGSQKNDTVLLKFSTIRREGTRLLNTADEVISVISSTSSYVTRDFKYSETDSIIGMHLNNKDLAEVRLMDEYGNTPTWCKIKAKGDSTVTIQCLSDGVRSPRSTELYLVYVIIIKGDMRILTYHVTISQASHFDYANNQRLVHTSGASGDPIGADGLQQVHQNKRILYYYPEQDVELPVRERNFYGWWRWYREGLDVKGDSVSDSDVPDSIWRLPPRNVGKYNYPYRIIGDSVMLKKKDGTDSVKVLVTMGRWTVFHYRSEDYGGSKKDPPAKNPRVAPPITKLGLATKPTLTYAVDISNYYDNLPMSLSQKNQVDTALLDTILEIKEPTLSLREVFELHPWTEMAENLNRYKSKIVDNDSGKYELANEHYMEDHVVMAPTGNKLLLSTEQRYNVNNVHEGGSSESLLGYYMRDDNWWKWSDDTVRQDTMIWCGGWDADCLWYTYNPRSKTYSRCNLSITKADDFLQVPVRNNVDTVYYCLRARSKRSTFATDGDNVKVTTVEGDSMFNICRYKVCYHYPYKYGPRMETILNNIPKALITNDEIEQKYDVLERLNFDYNEPGPGYTVYPHPLPWDDASYGYTYPETSDLPHNRLHKETDFPNHGEYGLINRIPYTSYWNKMEQHGGAEKGYMIYCDGMSSSGQVAALSLSTVLCSGQKMFLSAYVGNPSNQTGKANPNFIFSIQGKTDQTDWEDITTYITGDIEPATRWYQILIPINHTRSHKEEYEHFRIRIYNLASNFDGNDFIIDDLCVFATKPPLIAYQANTACKEEDSEKDTHVIMRIDYQGIPSDDEYNNDTVYYTVRKIHGDTSFIALTDHYLGEQTYGGADKDTPSVYGKLYIPAKNYVPTSEDSVFVNLNDLLDRFDATYKAHKDDERVKIFREGYIYETLEGISRPVKYVIHNALMDPEDTITVHISGEVRELLNSICGMTSHLHVSNRMVLELNGLENPHTEVTGLCVNSTYDISLRVKGSLYLDSVAPIDLNGSCINDWLLYGDTADASSKERYGYYYSDIKKVITEILRTEPMSYRTNRNQFAPNLSSINKSDLRYYAAGKKFKQSGLDPYTLISDLVKKGFLTLYKSKITTTVTTGDSAKYVIFPIVGTGTDALNKANVEVCPLPIVVKLKPDESAAGVPLMIGGLHRDTTEISKPIEVLMSEKAANEGFKLIVDSIMPLVGIKNITLRSTNDPNFREGVHSLRLLPDISYPTSGTYYTKGDSIDFSPAPGSYHMQPGYSYTFNVVMQTFGGLDTLVGGCAVGTIPFILSVMPDYLRWDPQSAQSNEWNNADNWIGVTKENVPIHEDAHYAPMAETYVVIPQVEAGLPYPVVPPLPTVWKDSVQKVNFEYNNCNVIRFLPGAAMGQQQRMRYSDAVIDMEMPQQKWAFRAAPVTGMLSGDIYMSNVDLNWASNPWKVAEFDASGRSYKTGNGSFWLSVYSRNTIHQTEDETEARSAKADWSKVTNGLNLSLPAGQGYAVYARTKSGKDAVVRLPKHDDIYYYYGSYGETLYDHYVNELETARSTNAAPRTAGKLAFHEDNEGYTMSNDNSVSTTGFVFGNPTMGYIDIWGFIDDNCLVEEFGYLDESGAASIYRTVSREAAMASTDTIIEQKRYLPPMRSIMVQKSSAATSLPVTLNSNRVVTDPSQVVPSVRCGGGDDQSLAQTPQRGDAAVLRKGIMTVTAINPCSPRCTSYLLLGQGYHADILSGEDALLTTLNIDNFSTTGTPTTPFNIYAKEDSCGLSIDLRDEIVNVPISFYMSKMTYDNVTHLWFTGVNAIDGPLVLYDAQTDTERAIIDGICLDIATPKTNHETRYYIRRRGWTPDSGWGSGVTTDIRPVSAETNQTMKIIHEGHVLIIRNGQVFTMMGQQVR